MSLVQLKRIAKRALRAIGLAPVHRNGHQSGREMDDGYYDKAFTDDAAFLVPFYKSPYYSTWTLIVDRMRRYQSERVLDIGCGPGQFAALVADAGFSHYTGIDFSNVAVEKARAAAPQFQFRIGDVRDPETYAGVECDTVVCMEVLEHLEEDLAVIARIPTGTRCLMTVPNFPWRSHVRHFESEDAVASRYGEFFDDFSVTRIKGVRAKSEQFYLLDGVRNSVMPVAAGSTEAS